MHNKFIILSLASYMVASYNGVAIQVHSRNVIIDKMRSHNSVAISTDGTSVSLW